LKVCPRYNHYQDQSLDHSKIILFKPNKFCLKIRSRLMELMTKPIVIEVVKRVVMNNFRNQQYGATNNNVDEFHCHYDKINAPSSNKRSKRVLWLSLAVCLGFMICEIVGGLLAQSLAIITDAAHLLTDFASMLISLFALYIAERPASQRMSFGWYRAEVMGAFLSVFMIWIITGILVYLAIYRIIQGNYDIDAPIMAITAGLGVVVNIVMGILLYFGGHTHSHGGAHHAHLNGNAQHEHSSEPRKHTNINVRAAMIHVLGDLIQSVGVLIAALLIFYNGNWSIIDPICTLLFSVIVVCTTFFIVRDALVVLLEGLFLYVPFDSF
uniref:Zinc transporter 2 n=1 Tax=Anisakis simplex TaxID=6269 RepID=A0A0M3K5F0_ANISI